MNSLIVFEHECQEKKILISDVKRLTHVQSVIKIQVGQTLKVTVLNHGLTSAKVNKLDKNSLELEIVSDFHRPETPEWHIVVGLSRPPTMKKVLEHGSCLGIKHFHFLPATLSEKSYATSKIWEEDKLQELLCDGVSQSATYWQLPKVSQYTSLSQLPSFNSFDKRILSLAQGSGPMPSIDKSQPLVLAFGPERGWTANEDEQLRKTGFKPVSIAPSVLRVEIALFAALGQCHFLVK